jgi:hypothetical protein
LHTHPGVVDAITHLEKEGMCKFWGCQSCVVVDRGGPQGCNSVWLGERSKKWPLMVKALQSFEMLVVTSTSTQCYVPEDRNSQESVPDLLIVPCLFCVHHICKWPELVPDVLLAIDLRYSRESSSIWCHTSETTV